MGEWLCGSPGRQASAPRDALWCNMHVYSAPPSKGWSAVFMTMRARWPVGRPVRLEIPLGAGIARKSTPFTTNPPAYCGSSSAARNAEMSFGREAGAARRRAPPPGVV